VAVLKWPWKQKSTRDVKPPGPNTDGNSVGENPGFNTSGTEYSLPGANGGLHGCVNMNMPFCEGNPCLCCETPFLKTNFVMTDLRFDWPHHSQKPKAFCAGFKKFSNSYQPGGGVPLSNFKLESNYKLRVYEVSKSLWVRKNVLESLP